MHRQSCYLFGRDHDIADVPVDHPSCSAQHAVWQYREYNSKNPETGEWISEVKPYLMDLESTNGTFLNGTKIESARYYELRDEDLIKFGKSSRDYMVAKGKLIQAQEERE